MGNYFGTDGVRALPMLSLLQNWCISWEEPVRMF